MKLRPPATKGHLKVGIVLIQLSLGSLIASFILDTRILPCLSFFFGVWRGVETGRYVEFWMNKKHEQSAAASSWNWPHTRAATLNPGKSRQAQASRWRRDTTTGRRQCPTRFLKSQPLIHAT